MKRVAIKTLGPAKGRPLPDRSIMKSSSRRKRMTNLLRTAETCGDGI